MQPEQEARNCLSIEDDQAALSCLKGVVVKYSDNPDVCRPRLVLLTQDGCDVCKEEATLHASDIARGIIEKINIKTADGKAIVKNNDIDFVPSLLLLDCKGKLIVPV